MTLVPSLLQAIIRLDGEAVVMHVGDRPYVVTPTGQVDLATRGLTFEAVTGIVNQLLPVDSQRALDEFGAAQYELPAMREFPGESFTIVAARGGDDVWAEIRRRQVTDDDRVPVDVFGTAATLQGAEQPTAAGGMQPSVLSKSPTVAPAPSAAVSDDSLSLPDASQLWPATAGPATPVQPHAEGREDFASVPVVEVSIRDGAVSVVIKASPDENDDLSLPDESQLWPDSQLSPDRDEQPAPVRQAAPTADEPLPVTARETPPPVSEAPHPPVLVLDPGAPATHESPPPPRHAAESFGSAPSIAAQAPEAPAPPSDTAVPLHVSAPAASVSDEPVLAPGWGTPVPVGDVQRPLPDSPVAMSEAPAPELSTPIIEAHAPVAASEAPAPVEAPVPVARVVRAPVKAPPVPVAEAPVPAAETRAPVAQAVPAPPVVAPPVPVLVAEAPAPVVEAPVPVAGAVSAPVVEPSVAGPVAEANVPVVETPAPVAQVVPAPVVQPSVAVPAGKAPVVEPPAPVAQVVPAPVVEQPVRVPVAVHEAPAPATATTQMPTPAGSVSAPPPAEKVPVSISHDVESVPAPPVPARASETPALPTWQPPFRSPVLETPPFARDAETSRRVSDLSPAAGQGSQPEREPLSTPAWQVPPQAHTPSAIPPERDTLLSPVLPLSRNSIRPDVPPPLAEQSLSNLDQLLRLAAARGASMLYLSSASRPSVRVDGEIYTLDGAPVLGPNDVESLLLTLMPERNAEALRTGVASEWICELPEVGRVRCLSFRDHRGPGGVFRMMPVRATTADQLGLTREIQALAIEPEGLVLVAGPRGSGKRTLMSAFVDLINRTRRDHIISIESEINVVHDRNGSLISQREVRGGAEEMYAAARNALREDPDVLVLEEVRTAPLMNLALEAAASGHLVIAGFPAHNASGAVDRIIDLYPPEYRRQVQISLAQSLRGVVAQVLLRKRGGGRLAAREVLLNTPAVASVLAEGRTSQLPLAIEGGRKAGMMPLNDALVGYVQSAAVDVQEAYSRSSDRAGFIALLKRQGVDTSAVERLA